MRPADRIASSKPYYFAQLNLRIQELRSRGMDVIRLDMGSPDLPPADFIVDALVAAARRKDAHGYTPFGGTPAFRQAVAGYYRNRFGVELDPQREVVGLIGSKEGIFNLSQVLLNPGDLSLVPDPGYPTYRRGAELAGAEVFRMPLLEENGFLPDLEAIPESVARRAKILWINYPNNPTSAVADLEFFERAVAFARRYDLVVAHDAPYVDVVFDAYRAPSLLEVPGAREVGVEFNSLSKTYNMAGWRLGMAVGNPEVVRYLFTYKSEVDSSHFEPVLQAGITALGGDQGWLEGRNAIYKERADLVVEGIRQAGLHAQRPRATLYVWARLPQGEKGFDFCGRLLAEAGVSATPGEVFGSCGEGYLRISLGTPIGRVREAMERFVDWMKVKI